MLHDGKAPHPGQIMRFPSLAKTFRTLAEHGKDGFYKGRIAEAIVEIIKNRGGMMELEDLAKHTSSFVEPIRYTYNGEVTVYEVNSDTSTRTTSYLENCFVVPSKWTRYIQTRFGLEYTYISLTGITALLALGILENIQEQGLVSNILEMEHNSAEYLHTLVEALRFTVQRLLHRDLADPSQRLAFAGDSPSLYQSAFFETLLPQTVNVMSPILT